MQISNKQQILFKINFFLFVFCFIGFNINAQNLIRNGSFDSLDSTSLYMWKMIAGTPDIINFDKNAFDIQPKKNQNENDQTGIGIAISYLGTEAIQQELGESLEKGTLYKLSCQVLAGGLCKTGLEFLTIALTSDELTKSKNVIGNKFKVQCFNLTTADKFIKYEEWNDCSIIFKATGKERYLSVGNFNNENSEYLKSVKEQQDLGPGNTCSYLIYDDFKLEKFHKKAKISPSISKNIPDKIVIEDILFESGKSSLNTQFLYKIDSISTILKEYKGTFSIVGYTDNVGSIEDNKVLSLERADRIKRLLVANGFDEKRISVKGLHELNPVMTNDTEYGRSKNRRVEIIFK